MSQDIVADGLNAIMNAKRVGKTQVEIKQVSKVLIGLFEMMKRSADHFQNDEQRLVRYWETIMEWSDERIIPFAKDDVEDFWIDVGRRGFPAVHHSESYTVANRPAYRVVLKSFLEGFTSDEAT